MHSSTTIHPSRLYHVSPPNKSAGPNTIVSSTTPSPIPITISSRCCVSTKYTTHSTDHTNIPKHHRTYAHDSLMYRSRNPTGGAFGMLSSSALDILERLAETLDIPQSSDAHDPAIHYPLAHNGSLT